MLGPLFTLHLPLAHSLCPPVVTVGVGADIVKSHLRLRLLRVRLEKYGLAVAAFGAGMVLGSGEGWVRHNIGDNVGDGVNLVHDLVHIDTATVRHLPVVAVPGKYKMIQSSPSILSLVSTNLQAYSSTLLLLSSLG